MEMTPDKWEKVKVLFEAALERPPEQRLQYLIESCAEEDLRAEASRLLANLARAGSFLDEPALKDLGIPPTKSGRGFLSPGQILANRFKLIQFLARGGMGEVYEAEDQELQERIAIKMVRPELLRDPRPLQRFKREVHLAKKVTHPNVCRIFDLFRHRDPDAVREEDLDIVFVSMELLSGETLSQRIRRGGCLAPVEALPLIAQIAGGLTAAHQAGVVHRDFKPSNVILVPVGDSGCFRAVITDFGLALRFGGDAGHSADLTTAHGVFGTPAYMAPEQIEGGEVTSAADIYALGLVIYEMVTGTLPFSSDTPLSMAVRRVHETAPSPRAVVPSLDVAWDLAILRCLERDPNKRFSSAEEVIRALSGHSMTPEKLPTAKAGAMTWVLGLVTLLILSAGAIFYIGRHRTSLSDQHRATENSPAHVVVPRRSVAVLGFKNLSAREDQKWISDALAEMLTTELAAGEQLRTIPSENVALMKMSFGLADADTYGKETLSRIRQSLGTEEVVLGSYLLLGDGNIRLDLRLQDAVAGETLAAVSEKGSQSHIDDLVGRAAAVFRAKLGAGEISTEVAAEVRAAQSLSPESNRLYAEGIAKLRSYDLVGARDLLQRAVRAAPEFPLAHSALATAWHGLGYDADAKTEAKKAVDLSSNLSREERLLIEGRFEEVSNHWDKAIETYKTLSSLFSDNLDYGLRVANVQVRGGKSREALDTVDALRRFPAPIRDDPRIDFAEAVTAEALGDFRQARIAASRAADKANAVGNRMLLAKIRDRECWDLHNLGEQDLAKEACEQAQHLYGSVGDRGSLAHTLNNIGNMSADSGDLKTAIKMYERALVICRNIGNKEEEAWALNNLGTVLREESEFTEAKKRFGEARTIFREIDAKGALASASTNLAIVAGQQGDLKGAKDLFEEALAIQRERGDKRRIGLILGNLSWLMYYMGDLEGAKRAGDEALETDKQIGNKDLSARALTYLSIISVAKGKLENAHREYEEAIDIWAGTGAKGNVARGQIVLADIALEEGHAPEAESDLRKALAELRTENDAEGEASARSILAEVLIAEGRVGEAAKEISQTEALSLKTKDLIRAVETRMAVAQAQAALGRAAKAERLFKDSLAQAKKYGFVPQVLEAQLGLGKIEMASGRTAAGRAHLSTLQKDASTKGFLLIAQKAAASRS